MDAITFLTQKVSYLQQVAQPFAPISIGTLPPARKALAIRLMPSGRGQEFQSKERVQNISFQVLAKSDDQVEALSSLTLIADKLELIDVQTYTEPNFLQQDEQSYIYTASFRAEWIKGADY